MDSAYPPHSPITDEPLIAPNRRFLDAGDRPASEATLVGAHDSPSWASKASLPEAKGLLADDANAALPRGALAPFPVAGMGKPLPVADYGDMPIRGMGGFDDDEKAVARKRGLSRRARWLIGAAAALAVIAVVIGLAVHFATKTPHNKSAIAAGGPAGATSSTSGNSPASTGKPSQPAALIFGGDGSTVTTDAGETFVYNNSFGGYWYQDPDNLYSAGGKPNSWTPAINETWQFGTDRIFGVNLGGWLVLEPFIAPSLYQQYTPDAVDEWTLSVAMAADPANGGLGQIETHYKTFITELDFAQIAGAGLNWVRIPFPFWAISKIDEEPFLEKVAWTYFLKAISWARKYGIRINLDLHTIPGSQNGWNHSGKLGTINFLNGAMGLANGERAMDYIRIITEFISEPEYSSVIPMFGIMNEPNTDQGPDLTTIKNFYYQTYVMMRGITGLGAGNGPMMSIFHAFAPNSWAGWLPNADRIALDYHPYTIFDGSTPTDNPPASYAAGPCTGWADYVNDTSSNFGYISSGEFSAAINQCGLFVVKVGSNGNYEETFGPGSCDQFINYTTWTPAFKASLQTFVEGQMDGLRDWFFWTWKIGPSQAGDVEAPFWSYSLGLANGWVPTDPRTAAGACARAGYGSDSPFDGTYQPWQTGGAGGSLTPSTTEDYTWPPATLADAAQYTATGVVSTLPPPSPTAGAGDGWTDAADTRPAWVPIAGCTYPDSWDAIGSAVPACATAAPST